MYLEGKEGKIGERKGRGENEGGGERMGGKERGWEGGRKGGGGRRENLREGVERMRGGREREKRQGG